jgi:hypothetical protein
MNIYSRPGFNMLLDVSAPFSEPEKAAAALSAGSDLLLDAYLQLPTFTACGSILGT